MNKNYICCICGEEFSDYGNNPYPICADEKKLCCDSCNRKYVIPARILAFTGKSLKNKAVEEK